MAKKTRERSHFKFDEFFDKKFQNTNFAQI